MPKPLDLEFSRIKSLFYELPGFKFEHGQSSDEPSEQATCKPFVGRVALVDKIADYIKADGGGAYLITGFRGVGKTTVVNKAIKQASKPATEGDNASERNYQTPKKTIIPITISLAQEKMEGIDVLKIITKKIYGISQSRTQVQLSDKILILLSVAILFSLFFSLIISSTDLFLTLTSNSIDLSSSLFLFPLVCFLIFLFIKHQYYKWVKIFTHFVFLANLLLSLSILVAQILITYFTKDTCGYLGLRLLGVFAMGWLWVFIISELRRILIYFWFAIQNKITKPDRSESGWWSIILNLFDKHNYVSKILVLLFSLLIAIMLEEYLLPFSKIDFINDHLKGTYLQAITSSLSTTINLSQLLAFIDLMLILIFLLLRLPALRIYSRANTPFNKVKELYDRLHIIEKSSESTWGLGLKDWGNFSSKFNQKKGTVDFRELEDGLLEFLELESKQNFVIVFDELDKLNVNQSANEGSKENKFAESFAERARQRQLALANILLTLKHFLNHAKAKLIFIAGRELYDADLADVADRDFFWGSIFNDVIYVESLLKSVHQNREQHEYGNSAPTYFIEQFLSEYLLIKNNQTNSKDKARNGSQPGTNEEFTSLLNGSKPSLKQYANQLISFSTKKIKSLQTDNEAGKNVIENVGLKAILFLNDFVIYLTYRSGGLPMKLNKIFEEYIVREKIEDSKDFDHKEFIYVNKPKQDTYAYFLRFTYDQQYEIGFIANLYRPFLTKNASFLSFLDDKVLVSIPFLIDHLLKLHEFGFASRNLEQIPELLEPNRAPALRQFIANLVSYLSIKHIRRVDNGLFSYRFYRSVSNEISFLSKLSAQSSAAFNFTLDESLSLKHSYLQRLRKSKEVFPFDADGKGGGANDRGHTISINSYLGDIHLYDKDYDEATAYYANASYTTRKKLPQEITRNQLVSLARNMLKHGLSLERAKAYDTALGIYGELNRLIFAYFDSHATPVSAQGNTPAKSETLVEENKQFISALLKSHFALILPSLAQLAIIEKKSLSGITLKDIENTHALVSELLEIERSSKHDPASHSILLALFNVKLANLLYFINFTDNPSNTFSAKALYAKALFLIAEYLFLSGKIRVRIINNTSHLNIIKFYTTSLIYFKDDLNVPGEIFQWTADWLNFYGDSLLAEKEDKIDELSAGWLAKVIQLIVSIKVGAATDKEAAIVEILKEIDSISEFSNLQKAIFCFLLAVKYNERLQSYRKVVSTLNKILTVIKLHYKMKFEKEKAQVNGIAPEQKLLTCLKDVIIKEVVKNAIRIYDDSLRVNLFEAKVLLVHDETKLLKLENFKTFPEIFNTTFNTPEAREALLLVHDIELYIGEVQIDLGLGKSLTNPYNNINNNWIRIHALSHRNNLVRRKYFSFANDKGSLKENVLSKVLGYDPKPDIDESKPATYDELKYCIVEGIFCCSRMIQNLNLFGASYVVSHFYFAEAHLAMAFWLQELFTLNLPKKKVDLATDAGKIATEAKELATKFKKIATKAKELVTKLKKIATKAGKPAMELEDLATEAGELVTKTGELDAKVVEAKIAIVKEILVSLGKLIGRNDLLNIDQFYHAQQARQHYLSCLQVHERGAYSRELMNDMYLLEDDFGDETTHFSVATDRYLINSRFIHERLKACKEFTVKKIREGINAEDLYSNESYFLKKRPDPEN